MYSFLEVKAGHGSSGSREATADKAPGYRRACSDSLGIREPSKLVVSVNSAVSIAAIVGSSSVATAKSTEF